MLCRLTYGLPIPRGCLPFSATKYDSLCGFWNGRVVFWRITCGGLHLRTRNYSHAIPETTSLFPLPSFQIFPPWAFGHRTATFRRTAVTEEERFDFLRPVLNPPQDSSGESLGAAAGAKGKRKPGPSRGRAGTGTGGAGARKGKKRMGTEFADAAGSATASAPDLVEPSGSAITSAVGAGGGGGLLALAGLDEEGRRRALLGGPAASGLGDDGDEEDYDNY